MVHFDIGGSSARNYGRKAFNIKIKDKNKDLYGRSQFRLRTDPRDPTFLRSKLCCDMINRMGLYSISANFAILYVNDEYFGFYVIMDAPKLSWIEQVFGEKDTTSLYKCRTGGLYLTEQVCAYGCENENDDVTDRTEWIDFLRILDNAKTIDEIEKVLDIESFTYLAVFDYLIGTTDNYFIGGHNYSMYKNKETGKWIMIYYDLDANIGLDILMFDYYNFRAIDNKDFIHYTVKEWFRNSHRNLINVGIFGNLPRLEKTLADVINDTFNPAILFPYIDELKEFIRPYIVHDKTPDENGVHSGVLNFLNPVDYSLEQWDANIEFTTISDPDIECDSYGLKYWILERYRTVCNNYNLECDPVYMDENYQYPIDKNVEGEINFNRWDGFDFVKLLGFDPTAPAQQPEEYQCMSEKIGYSCCKEGNTNIYESDENGDWGYDFDTKEWCGITPYDGRIDDEICWSEPLGYSCCKGCVIYKTDNNGKWGYEDNTWCGIQSYCS
ncbi:hypothetical protein BCR32DRAFT_207962 [Anaeromyces robustus]|uniref:CBM10 domain-containing protein n=1 Tax=Anaeromyces robustus TaxID=1754192 RepID=A0A1Y1WV25_9FUNG|nr:hypothetical protein BCR32DRAFT_207962 [Anaeromyces robustus]|eukprot:ORX77407.1 hypothetical protein BCR32DRAFT_207962 [Anaeromyces robustus]